ncbi:MAG: hypothetical protein LBK82_05290 [Planctomycetaceae bacterium]|nr:hypothetical protein [Planctomycetaceae bacterium]
MTPKRKAIPLTVVPLIHCRRVRRRDLSAKGRPPDKLPTFNENYFPLENKLSKNQRRNR